MPEGPECRVTADSLNKYISSKKIIRVSRVQSEPRDYYKRAVLIDDLVKLNTWICKSENPKVNFVLSKGKLIYMELGDYYIISHMGMDGSWSLEVQKESQIMLEFEGMTLYFNDSGLGKFNILTRDEMDKCLSNIGIDILSSEFTYQAFKKLLQNQKNQKQKICVLLMNQEIIAGIGNYLRAEILYQAQIDPQTCIDDLSTKNLKDLHIAIRNIANESYTKGGSVGYPSYIDFENPGKPKSGTYEPVIYRKTKSPKGEKIDPLKIAGRTMYWVPNRV